MIELEDEKDILDQDKRKKIIDLIEGDANKARKDEAFKRFECYTDNTDIYVNRLLLNTFSAETVVEMQYAITNISFVRKIIGKLARVYANGVKRTLKKKSDTDSLEAVAKHLKFNQKMKKTNRLYRLFSNLLLFVKPVKQDDGKFDLKLHPMSPHLYDVIPNPDDYERPMVVVLSDFIPSRETFYAVNPATANRTNSPAVKAMNPIDTQRTIQRLNGAGMSSIEAKEKKEYIWWSKNYHFTTNAKGEIKSLPDVGQTTDNPVKLLPFVHFAEDQDDCFWSEGGKDLVDGGIRINAMISNVNHVAIQQGYGQMYMTGKNLPKGIKIGPTHCIQIPTETGDPEAKVGYLNANPPIADLIKVIELYVALLLTTKNLSTSSVASNLSGSANAASGLLLLIDKSESNEDVEDQAQEFIDNEPKIWTIISAWMKYYKSQGMLIDELASNMLPDKMPVQLAFPKPATVITEKEELEIIQMRLDLGITTMVEAIMRDDPSLDEKSAQDKLKKILEDKMQRAAQSMAMNPITNNDPNAAPNADGKQPNPKQDAAAMPDMKGAMNAQGQKSAGLAQ
jgi:hypothetical protein